ncbi:MAG: site-specific DNA-methyltransferase [Caulobacteraceae bacterium]|nr:site-specific DNA-methyltransferase [Caulobacteraceae bacterium]
MILVGDVLVKLKELDDESINCVVTSPPYWGLRDYGNEGQIGLEPTPQQYIDKMVEVFREVRRVLRSDGTLWLNIGDSYASYRDGKAIPDTSRGDSKGTFVPKGSAKNRMALTFIDTDIKHKDLVGIPWMLAFALRADGWYLRQDIIWAKPNVMPESVRDRCTKSHEYVFLLTKSPKYYYDHISIKEPVSEVSLKRAQSGWKTNRPSAKTGPEGIDTDKMGDRFVNPAGRNKRDVWFIPTASFKGAHFAVMPERLVEPCVLAGTPEGGVVLDPFFGSGTVGVVAMKHNRKYVGIELNPEYVEVAKKRLSLIN